MCPSQIEVLKEVVTKQIDKTVRNHWKLMVLNFEATGGCNS